MASKLVKAVKSLYWRLVLRSKHQCEHCGSWETHHHWAYNRGWNHLYKQAYSARGAFCYQCYKVTWDDPLEEHQRNLPDWCIPHEAPDRDKCWTWEHGRRVSNWEYINERK